jgi:O-antigen ligase
MSRKINDKKTISEHNQKMKHFNKVSKKRTNIAIYCLILMVFISVGKIHELIPVLHSFHLGKIAFGLAAIILLRTKNTQKGIHGKAPQLKYLFCLFLLGLFSVVGSYWPSQSFSFFLSGFLNYLVIIWLMVVAIDSYEDLLTFIMGTLLSAFLLAGSSLLLNSDMERLSIGLTYDANDLAFILVLFLPLIYYMLKTANGFRKIFLVVVGLIFLVSIILTQSRGGLLGISTIVLGILMLEKVRIGKIFFFSIIILCVFSYTAPSGYWNRMATMLNPSQDYNTTSTDGRIEVWKRGLVLMMDHPLLGVGLSAFAVAEGSSHTTGGGKWSTAHNSFIQIGAELGAVGLFLFLLMIYSAIKTLRKARRELPLGSKIIFLINGVEVGLYGYIVSGFFLSQAYSSALIVLIGLSIVLVIQSFESPKESSRSMVTKDI